MTEWLDSMLVALIILLAILAVAALADRCADETAHEPPPERLPNGQQSDGEAEA